MNQNTQTSHAKSNDNEHGKNEKHDTGLSHTDHHQKAAEHHKHAAKHHEEAAKHHGTGDHAKGAHHAHAATGHGLHAKTHAHEATKQFANKHSGNDK